MEFNGLLDDKEGPEVQVTIPESVASRIEELMGGTEQFDSEEARKQTPIYRSSNFFKAHITVSMSRTSLVLGYCIILTETCASQ